jgi:hypothetical protein
MMQAYSNPKRESDPHALPDVEVFYQSTHPEPGDTDAGNEPGWYWWSCFPGCLPDGDPIGPFATEEEALANAQEGSES